VVRSPTFNIFHAFRILATDPAEGDRILHAYQVYPAKDAAAPPKSRIITPDGRAWSGTHPSGMAYWERLNEILQVEPVKEEDRLFMAMLRSLGLEKGKPFAPSPAQAKALTDGAEIGQLMAMANSFDKRFSTARYGGRWDRVVNVAMSQQPRPALDGRTWNPLASAAAGTTLCPFSSSSSAKAPNASRRGAAGAGSTAGRCRARPRAGRRRRCAPVPAPCR
jgi:hypothetical protein